MRPPKNHPTAAIGMIAEDQRVETADLGDPTHPLRTLVRLLLGSQAALESGQGRLAARERHEDDRDRRIVAASAERPGQAVRLVVRVREHDEETIGAVGEPREPVPRDRLSHP